MEKLKKMLDQNGIENWIEREALYMKGDAALICRCLESTKAKHIKQDGQIYKIQKL